LTFNRRNPPKTHEDKLIPKERAFKHGNDYLTREEYEHVRYVEHVVRKKKLLRKRTSYNKYAVSIFTPIRTFFVYVFNMSKVTRKFMSRVPHSIWKMHAAQKDTKFNLAMLNKGEQAHYLEESDDDLYARLIVHPSAPYKVAWDTCTMLFIIYSVISVPYFVCLSIVLPPGMITFHLLVDGLFFIDVLISFRTAFVERSTGIVNTVPSTMACHYFKGWFWVDFISCIPVDQLVAFYEGVAEGSGFRTLKLLRVVRLVRLVKLARITKLSRFIRFLEDVIEIPPALLKIIKLFVQVTFIGHVLACMWYFIGTQHDIGVREEESWWSDMNLPLPQTVSVDPTAAAEVYVASLYWTLASMTTVGYGDIVAKTDMERLWAIVTMLVGATVFGYIVGSMSTLVEQLDTVKARYKEKMAHVNNYLRERQLPLDLQKTIKTYYEQFLYRRSAFDESALLDNLSENLKREIIMFLNADIVPKIPIFQGIKDELFISNIMSIMAPKSFAGGDVIIKKDTFGQEMYFIVKGCVEVTARTGSGGHNMDTYLILREGSSFGELSLMLNSKRSANIIALNRCNTFVLNRTDLDEILLFYPQLKTVLQKHVVAMVASLTKRGQRLNETMTNQELIDHMYDRDVLMSDDGGDLMSSASLAISTSNVESGRGGSASKKTRRRSTSAIMKTTSPIAKFIYERRASIKLDPGKDKEVLKKLELGREASETDGSSAGGDSYDK
jgi:CRP-like cAMP-binding protein